LSFRLEDVMKETYRMAREMVVVLTLALLVFSPAAIVLVAQTTPQPQGPPAGLPDLVGMLKATPGVLGVDAARTLSGKQVIFAWFENKKAALNWYYSEGHQRLVKTLAGGNPGRTPMADVPDDGRPILAIASLTLSDKSQVSGVQLPVSQIAVELYAPLPGGIAAGGRFAPSSVKVNGLMEVSLAPK